MYLAYKCDITVCQATCSDVFLDITAYQAICNVGYMSSKPAHGLAVFFAENCLSGNGCF